MKKRSGIMAVCLACATAFSLAACGSDNGDKSGGDKAPDPSTIKTERVTEAQWISAFDFDTVANASIQITDSETVGGRTEKRVSTAKFDGNKSYRAVPTETGTEEIYFSKEGNALYRYDKNASTSKWEKSESSYFFDLNRAVGGIGSDLETMYNDFTYDSGKGAYIGRIEGDDCSVKIKNGKLSVLEVASSETDNGVTITYKETLQMYDIGSTSVTLPIVTGGSDTQDPAPGGSGNGNEEGVVQPVTGEITSAQWNAALSNPSGATSYTLEIDGSDFEPDTKTVIKVSEDGRVYIKSAVYFNSANGSSLIIMEKICTVENGISYCYTRENNGRWIRSEDRNGIQKQNIIQRAQTQLSITTALSDKYSRFSYNSAKKIYVGTRIDFAGNTFDKV